MKTVYLDQNKWIDLARRRKRHGDGEPTFQYFKSRIDTKNWRFPISAIHLIETLKRTDKKSRANVLKVMIDLSNGYSILSFRDVEKAEVINAFARHHDPTKIIKFSPVKTYPFYALGAIPTLSGGEHLPTHIQNELSALLALCMTEPEIFYSILSLIESPDMQQADQELDDEFVSSMQKDRKNVLQKPKEFRYKIYLARNIVEILRKYYTSLCGMFSLTKETFVPEDMLSEPEKTLEFLESMPSIDVRVKLHFDLLVDKSYQFHPHDAFDILFLATAVPYTDVVVTERTWQHRIQKTHLDTKYNTVIVSRLEDIVET